MIVLEQESRIHHLSDLPRRMVERWQGAAARGVRYSGGDKRDRLTILSRRLRQELDKQPGGGPLKIEGPANWFAWIVVTIGTPEDGLIIGRLLALGD